MLCRFSIGLLRQTISLPFNKAVKMARSISWCPSDPMRNTVIWNEKTNKKFHRWLLKQYVKFAESEFRDIGSKQNWFISIQEDRFIINIKDLIDPESPTHAAQVKSYTMFPNHTVNHNLLIKDESENSAVDKNYLIKQKHGI